MSSRLALAAVVAGAFGCRAHLPAQPSKNAVSISLPAAATRTIAGSYERQLDFQPRFSVAASPGLRFGGAGDYSARTLALGVEGRYWITGAPLIRRDYARQMTGIFAGFRIALAHTSTKMDGRSEAIGSTVELSETATVGYRVILFRRVELTATQGLQARHQFERRANLPAWTQFGFTFGATAGWMF